MSFCVCVCVCVKLFGLDEAGRIVRQNKGHYISSEMSVCLTRSLAAEAVTVARRLCLLRSSALQKLQQSLSGAEVAADVQRWLREHRSCLPDDTFQVHDDGPQTSEVKEHKRQWFLEEAKVSGTATPVKTTEAANSPALSIAALSMPRCLRYEGRSRTTNCRNDVEARICLVPRRSRGVLPSRRSKQASVSELA